MQKFICTKGIVTKRTGRASFTVGDTYHGYSKLCRNGWGRLERYLILVNNVGYTVRVCASKFRQVQ